MAALLRALFDICVMRRGPQDLPYSRSTTAWTILALLAVQVTSATLTDARPALLAARLAVTLVVLLGVIPQLLYWRGHGNRVPQTVLAFAGTSILFGLALLPLALMFQPHVGDPEPPRTLFFPGLVVVGLFLWKLRVDAAILRQALDTRGSLAQLLAIALFVFQFLLQLLLAPPDSPPTP